MARLFILLATASALSLAPAGLADKKFSYVDLQPKANQKLMALFSQWEGDNLASLPKGEQTLEEVKFKIADGLIRLGSKLVKEPKPNRVDGIEVGKAFAKLHILHASQYANDPEGTPYFIPDDTLIAKYEVHYEDGDTETVPVVLGKDVRGWWFSADDKGVTRGKVAWVGENEGAKKVAGKQIRLFLGTWENPHQTKRVVIIDYVKVGDTTAAPFCVAMTLEEK
jgi:hypothetical protein